MKPRLGGLLLVVAFGAGCNVENTVLATDTRCSAENCEILIGCYRVELQGDPDYRKCVARFGSPPGGVDVGRLNRYCAAACVVQEAGPLLQCAADNRRACEAAPTGQAAVLEEACIGGPTTEPTETELACEDACRVERQTCEDQCPLTSAFEACLDCSADCGLAWARCDNGCWPAR